MDANTASNIDVFNREAVSWSADTGLYQIEAELIDRYFPAPPARVLDIGCGAGRTTAELVQKGYTVKAIDLASALLEIARQRVPESAPERMNATELAFPAGTFDAAIFSFNGIDYVFPQSDRLKVFSEVRRVLRIGGVFYYSSHNGVGHLGRACASMSLRLWLQTMRFIAHQLGNRKIHTGYWIYREGSQKLLTHASSPKANLRFIENTGMKVGAVRGSCRYRQEACVSVKSIEEARVPTMAAGGDLAPGHLRVFRGTYVSLRTLTWCYPHIHYVAFT